MPDTKPRDQLADQLAELIAANPPEIDGQPRVLPGDVEKAAEVIVAAGWRPPARRITDPDDLDALPDLSVILHNEFAFQRFEGMWTCGPVEYRSDRFAGQTVTVLYMPEEERRG